jgi:protein-arginine kinase activator protein McsA
MKINKIICDVCKNEIDVEKERALSIFQKIEMVSQFVFKNTKGQEENEVLKVEYDICKNCSEKIEKYINSLKDGTK